MGLGVYIYIMWFIAVIVSVVIAGISLARHGFRGVGPAFAAITGSLLSWALVSAYIGVFEVDGYAGSSAFMLSIAVGIAGLALLVWSSLSVRRSSLKPDASG